MKKIAIVGGVVIVIAAAAGVSPYLVGGSVEAKVKQKVAVLNNKLDRLFQKKDIVQLEYNRGWFSSTAKTTIDGVVINHQITHGPYCFFGLGKIESSVELPTEIKSQLETFFDGQQPYAITTEIAFSGATSLNIFSPALANEKALPPYAKLTWKGLNLTYKFTKDEIDSSFEMPMLAVKGIIGSFTLEGVKSKGKGDRFFDNDLNFYLPKQYNSNSTASIDKLALSFFNPRDRKPSSFEINGMTTQGTIKNNAYDSDAKVGKMAGQFGTANFSLGSVDIKSTGADPLFIFRANPEEANWTNKVAIDLNSIDFNDSASRIAVALNYHQEQELNDLSKGLFGYGESYKVINLNVVVPNYSNFISDAELGYKLTGLPKKEAVAIASVYVDFFKKGFKQGLLNNGAGMVQQQQMLMMNLQKSMQSFAITTVQGTPSIASHFKVAGSKGAVTVNFNGALTKPDSSMDLQYLMLNAPTRIKSDLTINISETLVNELFKSANISDDQAAEIKKEILQKVPYTYSNGEYALNLEFKDGQFYVNGQVEPDFIEKYSKIFN